jgi:DNA polymerase I-like protein with 3'-5' exonuclease and polymerase domains
MNKTEKTITGRIDAKRPNLQNIPIRTEEGRRILDLFRRVTIVRGEHRREENE